MDTTLVPLFSASGTYREWDVTIGDTQYCIVDEDGIWTLLRRDPDSRDWLDTGASVEVFLWTHQLTLAA